MSRVAVIGAGSWGAALAIQAYRAGHHVALIARSFEAARAIDAARETPRLAGIRLPDALAVADAIPAGCDLLLWVVPMQQVRASLAKFRPPALPLVICAKGVEHATHHLPLEVAAEAAPQCPAAYLGGPNFAREVALGLPAAATVASLEPLVRDEAAALLATETFRLYGNDDPIGAQLGGAAKNVIAIAAGVVSGAGLGENARAALVTRGLAEISRLAVAAGGRAETVMGLTGLGDLLLTCTSAASRNFSLGHALGAGKTLEQALAGGATVEGVATAEALLARAGDVDLPICQAVADFLSGRETLDSVMRRLLSRPRRDE